MVFSMYMYSFRKLAYVVYDVCIYVLLLCIVDVYTSTKYDIRMYIVVFSILNIYV